jgi:hypothetical protein
MKKYTYDLSNKRLFYIKKSYKISRSTVIFALLLTANALYDLNPLQKALRPWGVRQSHYLLLLSGEYRPFAKHNKNSTCYFDKSIFIGFISAVDLYLQEKDCDITKVITIANSVFCSCFFVFFVWISVTTTTTTTTTTTIPARRPCDVLRRNVGS